MSDVTEARVALGSMVKNLCDTAQDLLHPAQEGAPYYHAAVVLVPMTATHKPSTEHPPLVINTFGNQPAPMVFCSNMLLEAAEEIVSRGGAYEH